MTLRLYSLFHLFCISPPYHHLMIAVRGIGGIIRYSFQFVGIEDIIDPPDTFELTEGILIAFAGIAESIGQRAFHPMIGIGGGGIVEVATYHDRVGGTTDLFGDIVCLGCTLPEVLFHIPYQPNGCLDPDRPRLGAFLQEAPVYIDAGGLQMVVDDPHPGIRQLHIGNKGYIERIPVIEGIDRDQGIAAVDGYRQMIRPVRCDRIGQEMECLPDRLGVIIFPVGGFLHTKNIGLLCC